MVKDAKNRHFDRKMVRKIAKFVQTAKEEAREAREGLMACVSAVSRPTCACM